VSAPTGPPTHGAPGALMAAEIAEQPDVLARVLDSTDVAPVAEAVRRRRPRFVLFAARGTSDHAALYGKYLVEIILGLPAGLASPSTMTVYGTRPDLRDVLLIAISQSGESPDLVRTAEVARGCGASVLGITNAPASALAAAADHHLDVRAGPEIAVAATKSYTAELLATYLLVDGVRGGRGAAVREVPAQVAALVERRDEVAALSQRYRFADRIVTTARGYSYPTAREAALKLMETSYLAAAAYSAADLMHGPLAMLDRDHPVLAVVPDGTAVDAIRPVLERLRERGSDLTIFGGQSCAALAHASFVHDAPLAEEAAPIVGIVPLQLLALEMALTRGEDPDRPRGLSKATRTW